jgi:DNA-binding IclR family transcriptional regulator
MTDEWQPSVDEIEPSVDEIGSGSSTPQAHKGRPFMLIAVGKLSSLDKALEVLITLGEVQLEDGVHLSEIVEKVGISRPTAYRFLQTLRKYGLVSRDEATGNYRLGAKILVLGAQMNGAVDLRKRALPLMQRLVEKTGLTAHLGVRDDNCIVYIDKVEGREPIRLATGVGWRSQIYSTGLGKAILAYLPQQALDSIVARGLQPCTPKTLVTRDALLRELESVRSRGYAVDNEENELGVRCVGAPVFDHTGSVVAAMSVSGTTFQIPRKGSAAIGRIVHAATSELSEAFGHNAGNPTSGVAGRVIPRG